MFDMVAKGRHARGERHGNAKLTAANVLEIRHRRAADESLLSLARAFGVSDQTISDVVLGRLWSHVPLERAAGE